jgi:phosphoribosylformylglycinamidine cyclo-ligase
MRDYGVNIILTGGETADVGDLVRTVIVDSTVCARMRRDEVIDNSGIASGDVVVGFASYGKANYEDEYNGGTGSNGLTSARHDLFEAFLGEKYPESFDSSIPKDLVYTGTRNPSAIDDLTGVTYGKLLLSPTRTYMPIMKKVIEELRKDIHGIVHCSGGAQTKVLNFIDNLRVVKDNMFEVPPLFRYIQCDSGTSWSEMYKVFNMGHRLEVYTTPEAARKMIVMAASMGLDAQIIGRVEESKSAEVVLETEFGKFNYGKS